MRKLLPSLLKTDEMNPAAKGVLLVVGSYVVTVGMAAIIIALAVMILLNTVASCGTVTRALPVLLITIAAIFFTSAFVVRGVARKITPNSAGCLAIVGVYGVAMLVSYVFIAFGLLVLFNC